MLTCRRVDVLTCWRVDVLTFWRAVRPTFAYVVPCLGLTGVRRCGKVCEFVPVSVSVLGDRRAVGEGAFSTGYATASSLIRLTFLRVRRSPFGANRYEKEWNGL